MVLTLMDEFDFKYIQSSAQYYEWVRENYPQLFARIRREVEKGRWLGVPKLNLGMEGAPRREWRDRVVLPSLLSGCALTRRGVAEWSGGNPMNP